MVNFVKVFIAAITTVMTYMCIGIKVIIINFSTIKFIKTFFPVGLNFVFAAIKLYTKDFYRNLLMVFSSQKFCARFALL